MADPSEETSQAPGSPPTALLVAAVLAIAEGLALATLGVLLLIDLSREQLVMGLTSSAFLVLYGAALMVFAYRMRMLIASARPPVVMAQLLQILVASSSYSSNVAVSLTIIVVSVAVIVGIFVPASLRALAQD